MDQDYLTSADSYFNHNISPPPPSTRSLFRHNPVSIVQSKSEGSGSSNGSSNDFGLEPAPTYHIEDSMRTNHDSFAARRGHLSSSLERTHHLHQHQLPHLHQHNRHSKVHLDLHHSRQPHHSKHKRAGSTPPAPLSDGGHASALRFSENKRHSHSTSHTPFSSNSQLNSHSSSRTSFQLAPEQLGATNRSVVLGATVTPVVVTGFTAFSTAEGT